MDMCFNINEQFRGFAINYYYISDNEREVGAVPSMNEDRCRKRGAGEPGSLGGPVGWGGFGSLA